MQAIQAVSKYSCHMSLVIADNYTAADFTNGFSVQQCTSVYRLK